MSDNEPGEPQGEPDAKPETGGEPAEDVTDWKAEARKWEQRAKDNKSAAEKLQLLEDAQKTEIQKATERAEAAEQALKAKEAETLRLTIAAKHGITGDHLDLLSGADEAELEARASKIASLIPKDDRKGAYGPYVPSEGKPGSGALGGPGQVFADFLKTQLG